jgi:predicted nucleic acid-binding protein
LQTQSSKIYGWGQIEAAFAAFKVIEELLGRAQPLTTAVHARAVVLAREHALSFYDALIVDAAPDAGCKVLCSEDLRHGQRFGTLRVENPFRRQAGS